MHSNLTAVVIGATGLIGEALTQLLLENVSFTKVRILVRRPVALHHAKLEIHITDFSHLQDMKKGIGKGDCLFSCIGTTQKSVKGDKDQYRKTDYDIPLDAARIAKEAGFSAFLIVSSIGASASSGNFYLRLKGEVEDALKSIGLTSLYIFQPSFLLGARKKQRVGEAILKNTFKALSVLLSGTWRKYRAIESRDVAKAMLNAALKQVPGIHTITYDQIITLAAGK